MNNLERQQDILLRRIATLEAENARVHDQRDALLKACETALFHLPTWNAMTDPTRKMLEEVIAAAKEGK